MEEVCNEPRLRRAKNHEAEQFYAESLRILKETGIPFLVGGTFAVNFYTGIGRPTKDLDIFCKASDYPRIIQAFTGRGYTLEVEDERWLAKVTHGKCFFDLIFNSANGVLPVTDEWFKESQTARFFDLETAVLPVTELIWSKVFVQDRYKYDGADVAHLILKQHPAINWKRLLAYGDQYWEVLLIQILDFRFIYPSEREVIPRWVLDELLNRLQHQINLPTSRMKVCRGRLFSREDYAVDITRWGFADMIGAQNEHAQGRRHR